MHTNRKSPFESHEALLEGVEAEGNMPLVEAAGLEEMAPTPTHAAAEAAASAAAEAAVRELSNKGILKGAMRGMAQGKIKAELLPSVTKVVKRWAE